MSTTAELLSAMGPQTPGARVVVDGEEWIYSAGEAPVEPNLVVVPAEGDGRWVRVPVARSTSTTARDWIGAFGHNGRRIGVAQLPPRSEPVGYAIPHTVFLPPTRHLRFRILPVGS